MRSFFNFALLALLGAAIVGKASAGLVDAREKGNVIVENFPQNPSPYDMRKKKDNGCNPDGCKPENTRDGKLKNNSRWSCKYDLEDRECFIYYSFEPPQMIKKIRVAYYKGDERVRTMVVEKNDGDPAGEYTSSGMTNGFETYDLPEFEFPFVTLMIKPSELPSFCKKISLVICRSAERGLLSFSRFFARVLRFVPWLSSETLL
ncbi:unnamed protein product [Discosporangium mesarthrocarpum]